MKIIAALLAALFTSQSLAQKLPPPSREVFKCEERGKVVYSASPCLGGKRVDVEPTRGMNKSSGTERVGADVRQERHNEQMAEALRPIFGETAKQREKRHRRFPLTAKAKVQCNRLDTDIPVAEESERTSMNDDLPAAQAHLHLLRSKR